MLFLVREKLAIDRDKAIWFARRFTFYDYCRLIHGEVKQRDVHAYFQARDESETVASDVKALKIDKLAPTQ